jgi:hypothetical protein
VADVHVPIIGPMIHTFSARELMAFFGYSEAMTVEIAGKGDADLLREFERRTRKGLSFLWSEPNVFTPLFNAVQDKNIFGNTVIKVMPAYDLQGKLDTTKLFETEVINLWNFLLDPHANTWDKVEWAGHRKLVSLNYLESRYGDEVAYKKIKSTLREKNYYASNSPRGDTGKKGIELTEIWDRVNEEVLTFIDRKYLIRKLDKFPYKFPFVLGQCFTESNTPFGWGIADELMWTQLYANEMANLRLDDLIRNVHTRWVVPSALYTQFEVSGPGDMMMSNDMTKLPVALSAEDVTQNLSFEIDSLKQSAYSTMGVSPWTQVNIPSKRMTTPEVMLTEKGSGRFWTLMKNAESHFWLPWAERVLDIIIRFAPDDFFDKVAGENVIGTAEYEKFGQLRPKDLKKYHTQIQAKMASEVLKDEQKRMGIAQFIRVIGSIAPIYLNEGEAFKLLGETFDIPGIEKILKTDEEVRAEKAALMEQLAAQQAMAARQEGAKSLAGGGGYSSMFRGG